MPPTFRAFLEKHRTDIPALEILSGRRDRKRLTAPLLKDLAKALLAENPTWDEETLWQAHADASPEKVKGASAAGRFADLVPLVRFALEQEPMLAPFADSTRERFADWVARKHATLTRDQLAWLERVRDHIGRFLRIELEDLERVPFSNRGGTVRANRLFGKWLPKVLEELNEVLAA